MLTLDTPSVYRLLELVSTGLVDDRLLIPWCDRMIEQHAEVPYWVLECAMTHDPDEIQRQLWEHLRDHHSPYAFRGEEDREAYQLDCYFLRVEQETLSWDGFMCEVWNINELEGLGPGGFTELPELCWAWLKSANKPALEVAQVPQVRALLGTVRERVASDYRSLVRALAARQRRL